jgi:hypothetical protein
MEIGALLEISKEYDLLTLIVIVIGWLVTNKKIELVDRAVNHRPIGAKTISEEVTEINHKLDLFAKDLSHVKREIDNHRAVDEVAFNDIRKDIRILANKV